MAYGHLNCCSFSENGVYEDEANQIVTPTTNDRNFLDWIIGTTRASLRNIIGTSETKEWLETKAIVQEFTESNTVGKHLEEYPVNQKWFIDHASKKGWQRVIVHFKRCWKTYFPNESIKLQVWYNIMYPSPKPTWMRKPTICRLFSNKFRWFPTWFC